MNYFTLLLVLEEAESCHLRKPWLENQRRKNDDFILSYWREWVSQCATQQILHERNSLWVSYATKVLQVFSVMYFMFVWVLCTPGLWIWIRIRMDPHSFALLDQDPHSKCGSGSSCKKLKTRRGHKEKGGGYNLRGQRQRDNIRTISDDATSDHFLASQHCRFLAKLIASAQLCTC